MDFIEVTINNWEKYNVRCGDYVRPWWFSMNNRILEDADVYNLTDAELRAWIYVLSQASLQKNKTCKIDQEHAVRVGKVSKNALKTLISKFVVKSIVSESGRHLAATVQDKTEQNKTVSSVDDRHPLQKLWNENCGELPKSTSLSASRIVSCKARWRENALEGYWREVIIRVARSPFCNGTNDRGWRATFDWVLKPDTHIKITEGKYDASANKKSTVEARVTGEW